MSESPLSPLPRQNWLRSYTLNPRPSQQYVPAPIHIRNIRFKGRLSPVDASLGFADSTKRAFFFITACYCICTYIYIYIYLMYIYTCQLMTHQISLPSPKYPYSIPRVPLLQKPHTQNSLNIMAAPHQERTLSWSRRYGIFRCRCLQTLCTVKSTSGVHAMKAIDHKL